MIELWLSLAVLSAVFFHRVIHARNEARRRRIAQHRRRRNDRKGLV